MRHIDMPKTGRSRGRLGAILLAAALVAVSCGSDKGSATPTAGGTAAPAPADTTAAAPADTTAAAPADTTAAAPADTTAAPVGDKVTDFAGYIGGTGAADASLSPIKIGYFNQQGGAVEVTHTNITGIQAAVDFVNKNAGGIGGHPLELVTCYIANTEEEGQQCGQQFANDSSIVAIETGPTFIGTESFYAAVAGSKPVVAGVSVSAADTVQATAAVLFGGAKYILAPYATFARDTLHVKSAALIYPEGSGQDEGAAGQASAFEAAGIPTKVVPYAADTPDLTVPLLAAGAQDVDLVMPVINPNDCVKFEQATQQLGIPDEKVLASPICINADVGTALGDLPQWLYAVASSLSIDPTDPSVPPYTDILKAQGLESSIGDPWVLVGFGQMMTLAKWLNAIGPDNITSDAIAAQMKAFKGPLILGSPVLQCGKYPKAPGVCNDFTQFYKYNGKDAGWKLAGGFVGPPEGWVA
ncbi:MAG: ABC transporter substrate-binding protein [Ilumatobacteraceae bacterium]|nr:ABC transporter substrate-binding protein [Ilumatobacteraceae bacterium]